jgi:miniconductance mechanosensitive channel
MNIEHFLYDYLIKTGVSDNNAAYLNMIILLIVLLIIAFFIHFITRKILIQLFTKFADKSKTNFDDLLVKNKVPRNISHIIPLILSFSFFVILYF